MYGFKNSAHEIILPARYSVVFDKVFNGDFAYVIDERGIIAIDRKDSVLFKPYVFDNGPDEFHEGLARFQESGKIGFVNEDGEKVIAAQYEYVGWFEDGLAEFNIGGELLPVSPGDQEHIAWHGGKWGFINHKGEIVIEAQYDEVAPFKKGKAKVVSDGEEMIINKNGKVLKVE